MGRDGVKEELSALRIAFAVFFATLASLVGAVFTLSLPDDLQRAGVAVGILLIALVVWIGMRCYVLIGRL